MGTTYISSNAQTALIYYQHRKTIFVPTTTFAEKPADPDTLVFGRVFTDHMLTAEWNDETGWDAPKIGPLENFSMHPGASVFHYSIEVETL